MLPIEHIKHLCTRGIVQASIEGGGVVDPIVGSIILGQEVEVSYLGPDAAYYHSTGGESLVLKIEAPAAICIITPTGALS